MCQTHPPSSSSANSKVHAHILNGGQDAVLTGAVRCLQRSRPAQQPRRVPFSLAPGEPFAVFNPNDQSKIRNVGDIPITEQQFAMTQTAALAVICSPSPSQHCSHIGRGRRYCSCACDDAEPCWKAKAEQQCSGLHWQDMCLHALQLQGWILCGSEAQLRRAGSSFRSMIFRRPGKSTHSPAACHAAIWQPVPPPTNR